VPEQLLNVLKICLLVLLYLFFIRVLRAVWAEVRDPVAIPVEPTPPRRRTAAAPTHPTMLAPKRRGRRALTELVTLEPDAGAGTAYPLASEMTIGRAAGCNIVIDDHFVSSAHTRIFQRDDTWMIEDLGSTNGTYLNRRKVTGPSVMHKGDQVQVGNVVLEVR
jgi:pSer/pThr/pTyr-binding forkhead associated (FHA) protein